MKNVKFRAWFSNALIFWYFTNTMFIGGSVGFF